MVYWAGSEGSTNNGRNQELFHLAGLGNLWTGQGSCYSRGRSTVFLQSAWESDKNHISGAWGCHYVLSLGRMLFLETLGQVYFICRTSKKLKMNWINLSRILFYYWYSSTGLWLSLKTRTTSIGNKHKRGSLCPPSPAEYQGTVWRTVTRTVNLPITIFSLRFLPQGKAAAVGIAFGESVFLRKVFMPILVGGYFSSLSPKIIHFYN